MNDFDGREESRALPPGLLDDLRELSRREGATLFATLMAGLHAVLHRYTGQDDLVVGTTSANRRRAALTPLIGFLVNTLPIRCDASGDPPFTEFLGRVREAMVGAYEHQDLPFARIVAALGGARDASRAPVVQVMFNLIDDAEQTHPGRGRHVRPGRQLAEATESKFDICCSPGPAGTSSRWPPSTRPRCSTPRPSAACSVTWRCCCAGWWRTRGPGCRSCCC